MLRVQLDMSEEGVEAIKRLMQVTGTTTRKDFINDALALFQWAIGEVQKGNTITSLNATDKHYKEVVMPALQRAANGKIKG